MDERLVEYVGAQWTELVDYAKQVCDDADDAEAQELVLATLTRVAGRWPLVPDKDHPDEYVRRELARTITRRAKRRADARTSS